MPDQEPVVATSQVIAEPVLTDEEMAREKRRIEAELQHFQQQADHVARALAGDTPHQREMRRLREIDRQEREERRLAAVEMRIEHMVERELQREARQEQRRQRLAERAHRSSVSPSPERGDDSGGDGDLDENDRDAGTDQSQGSLQLIQH